MLLRIHLFNSPAVKTEDYENSIRFQFSPRFQPWDIKTQSNTQPF